METLDLRCESYDLDNMFNDAWTNFRIRKLKKFLYLHGITGRVLCIGGENDVDKHICEFLGIKYEHTCWDLNYPFPDIDTEYDYIFCFDVLEHLLNPFLCLEELKKLNCLIVLTYPRHPFVPFWGRCHFHEFSRNAFYTLIKAAGFKILAYENFSCRKEWWKFFNGIRPVLRFIFLMFGFPRHEIYIME